MYVFSPAVAILDITMGKLSKFKPQVPFTVWKGKTSSDGEGSHSEKEKEKYVGPYDNAPIPRLTIHSFIMGVFVRLFPLFFSSPKD
jgi:MFS transporter, SP family, sugar:H+ symporter